MNDNYQIGSNTILMDTSNIGKRVSIGHNCIIENDVIIGDNVFIDNNTIIRKGTIIGDNSFVASNCIIGEYMTDYNGLRKIASPGLKIGNNALIRSGTIIYTGSKIGDYFQTGHQVNIREKSEIGNHVSVGTLSDIQGNCRIGNNVRLHSNVHIGQLSVIDDFVWIFPYVVLTNDPTPPSENLIGVHINSFAILSTGSIILPGVEIGQDSLIGAGAVVTKSVEPYMVAVGNPAKTISDVRNVKSKITGKNIYPWRYFFDKHMPWEGIGFEKWYDSLDLNKSSSISTLL